MILVTGGTGLVGSHLLYELAATNNKVKASIRPSSNISKVREVFGYYTDKAKADALFERIEWILADINDIPSLELAFKEVTEVYHCAALISFDPSDEQRMRKINIEGTANIVNLCIANQVSKLCFVSSVAAIGSPLKGSSVDEKSKWNSEENHNDYAISKYGAEIEVWRGTQEGLDAVIVNPGVIIGPGFWNSGSGKIFSKIDKGLDYHFPKVTGFVGVRDTVKSMITLMNSSEKNQQYIIVSENLSFERVFKETARYMDKKPPSKRLKKWMIALGWIFQKIGSWFGGKRQITRASIRGLYEEVYFDNTSIRNSLDFDFTPMSQVLKETAKFYKADKN